MPVTTSATQALRKDRRREAINDGYRKRMKDAMRKVRLGKMDLDTAFSIIDKSEKRNIIHTRRAARLKSRVHSLVKVSVPSSSKKKAVSSASRTKTKTKKASAQKKK